MEANNYPSSDRGTGTRYCSKKIYRSCCSTYGPESCYRKRNGYRMDGQTLKDWMHIGTCGCLDIGLSSGCGVIVDLVVDFVVVVVVVVPREVRGSGGRQ